MADNSNDDVSFSRYSSDPNLILINLQIMTLEYTLHHHILGINAIALSPDGDRLLSGGKSKLLTSRVTSN